MQTRWVFVDAYCRDRPEKGGDDIDRKSFKKSENEMPMPSLCS